MTNPYAPPRAAVRDVVDPRASMEPADRSTRLGAALLDGIIITLMISVPVFIGMIGGMAMGLGSVGGGATLALGGMGLGLIGFVAWVWITIKYVTENGQTIANRWLGIKVIRTDGSPISLGRIFWLRNIVNGL